MQIRSRLLIVAAVLMLCTTGCGYHFSGEGPGPKPGLHNIAIPVFENKTSEPDLGAIFAGELRKEFMRRGSMRVVPQDEAEAVFRGTITNIYSSAVAHRDLPLTYNNALAIETRLYVVLEIRCIEIKTGKVLWQDPNFTYFKVYRQLRNAQDPDPIFSFDSRKGALQFLAKEMSTRIHDRFLSNF